MFARYVILSLILVAFMSAAAFADGKFYGTITYRDCDCTDGAYADRVKITPLVGGDADYQGVSCKGGGGYTTVNTYPPGFYMLGVVLSDSSDCVMGQARQVYHGEDDQEVNLIVDGPGQGGS